MTQLGGRGGETLGGLVIPSSWLETGKVRFSISGGISLFQLGISGDGLSGMRGGGRLKARDSRVVEVGVISTSALWSGKVGLSGRWGSDVELGSVSLPDSEGTGMSGAGPAISELGVSRIGSAEINTESRFGFLKRLKGFLFSVVTLGGGAAGTSSAVLSF